MTFRACFANSGRLAACVAGGTIAAGMGPTARAQARTQWAGPWAQPAVTCDTLVRRDTFAAEVGTPLTKRSTQVHRAEHSGRVGLRHSPRATHVTRIVLTGGPCAGKSSALEHLIKEATGQGFDVYAIPECATILFSSGAHYIDDPAFQVKFMTGITQLQLQMERTFTMIAEATGRPSILVCDRGILDNKGYISSDGWLLTMKALDESDKGVWITEDYVLKRYDCVIHMSTSAKGAEKFYKYGWVTDDSGKKVFRRETPEMAREMDDKMLVCWEDHPHHIVVSNEGSFNDKIQKVSDAVLAAAKKHHPQRKS